MNPVNSLRVVHKEELIHITNPENWDMHPAVFSSALSVKVCLD